MPTKLKTLPHRFKPGFIKEMDQRTALAARLATSFAELTDDLGGAQHLTHSMLALAERFCFLEAMLQNLEVNIAADPKGSDQLMGRWVANTNSLVGLAKTLGVERRKPKKIGLRDYLEEAKT